MNKHVTNYYDTTNKTVPKFTSEHNKKLHPTFTLWVIKISGNLLAQKLLIK